MKILYKTISNISQIIVILLIIKLSFSSKKVSAKASNLTSIYDNDKFDELSSLRNEIHLKNESSEFYYYKNKYNYKVIAINDCTNILNKKLDITKEKTINNEEEIDLENKQLDIIEEAKETFSLYNILCYFGPSRNGSNIIIKEIYKIFGDKVKDLHLKRGYSDTNHIVTLGRFLSELEARPLQYLLNKKCKKPFRIKKEEISNNPEEIIKILESKKIINS